MLSKIRSKPLMTFMSTSNLTAESYARAESSQETCICQTQVLSLLHKNPATVVEPAWSEVDEVSTNSLPRSVETQPDIVLARTIQSAQDVTVRQTPLQYHVQPLILDNNAVDLGPSTFFAKSHRHRSHNSASTSIATLLGVIHYSTTTYQVTRSWGMYTGDENTSSDSTTNTETETNIRFVPYRWTARLAVKFIHFQIQRSWVPRNMSVYTVRADADLWIF